MSKMKFTIPELEENDCEKIELTSGKYKAVVKKVEFNDDYSKVTLKFIVKTDDGEVPVYRTYFTSNAVKGPFADMLRVFFSENDPGTEVDFDEIINAKVWLEIEPVNKEGKTYCNVNSIRLRKPKKEVVD